MKFKHIDTCWYFNKLDHRGKPYEWPCCGEITECDEEFVTSLKAETARMREAIASFEKKAEMFLAEHDENVRLHFENVDLKEQNARYRKALEKYANPETHSMDEHGFVWHGDYFDYETARAALEGKE